MHCFVADVHNDTRFSNLIVAKYLCWNLLLMIRHIDLRSCNMIRCEQRLQTLLDDIRRELAGPSTPHRDECMVSIEKWLLKVLQRPDSFEWGEVPTVDPREKVRLFSWYSGRRPRVRRLESGMLTLDMSERRLRWITITEPEKINVGKLFLDDLMLEEVLGNLLAQEWPLEEPWVLVGRFTALWRWLLHYAHGKGLGIESGIEEDFRPETCPHIIGIRLRERRARKHQLREKFKEYHKHALSNIQSRGSSFNTLAFGAFIRRPQTVWKKGFDGIRRILGNKLPGDILEVFGSIQLSRAMSDLKGSDANRGIEQENNFATALLKWRQTVAQDQHLLFDEIAALVWNVQEYPPMVEVDGALKGDCIGYLRQLITNLVHDTSATCGLEALDFADEDSAASQSPGSPTCSCQEIPQGRHAPSARRYQDDEHSQLSLSLELPSSVSYEVFVIIGTSIFMIILVFLIVFQYPLMPFAHMSSLMELARNGFFEQYCYIVICLLGFNSSIFETDPIFEAEAVASSDYEHLRCWHNVPSSPDTPFTSTSATEHSQFNSPTNTMPPESSSFTTPDTTLSLPSSKLLCHHCGKTFLTSSNRGKHERESCPSKRGSGFACRKCGKVLKGSWYHEKHERACTRRVRP